MFFSVPWHISVRTTNLTYTHDGKPWIQFMLEVLYIYLNCSGGGGGGGDGGWSSLIKNINVTY